MRVSRGCSPSASGLQEPSNRPEVSAFRRARALHCFEKDLYRRNGAGELDFLGQSPEPVHSDEFIHRTRLSILIRHGLPVARLAISRAKSRSGFVSGQRPRRERCSVVEADALRQIDAHFLQISLGLPFQHPIPRVSDLYFELGTFW